MSLTVLVNAGPWLPVPPSSYGGVENMLAYLIPELRRLGHRVLLSTVRDSSIEVDQRRYRFREGQLRHIAAPYCDAVSIALSHMQDVVEAIRTTPEIDVVHDVLEFVGPSVLAALGPAAPPGDQVAQPGGAQPLRRGRRPRPAGQAQGDHLGLISRWRPGPT